jgi:serine/threonine protein phosphatase 1
MQPFPADRPTSALASVPDGTRVYAVGDIHGRADLLDRLLKRLADDADKCRPERIVVVFLGDFVDRGPNARAVVERLMAGPPAEGGLAGGEWICLKGNHEEYMIRFLTELSVGASWLWNGGHATVQSYAAIPEGHEHDTAALQLLLSRALPPSHLRFLSRLRMMHVEGDYVFVHAGIRPGIALADQDPTDLMWIRDDFLFDPNPLEKVVVHGHTIAPVPEIRPNRIGIDTGAYASGNLTALVLEGTERRFIVS